MQIYNTCVHAVLYGCNVSRVSKDVLYVCILTMWPCHVRKWYVFYLKKTGYAFFIQRYFCFMEFFNRVQLQIPFVQIDI